MPDSHNARISIVVLVPMLCLLAGCSNEPGAEPSVPPAIPGEDPSVPPATPGENLTTAPADDIHVFHESFEATVGVVSPFYRGPEPNCVNVEWEGDHVLVGGNVTMFWNATTPASARLGLGFRSGNHGTGEDGARERADGSSPLPIDLSGSAPLEGKKGTWMVFYGTPERGFGVQTMQDVTIDIRLIYRGAGEPVADGNWVCN